MKAWYSKVRDTELIDGSVRADYVVTFETDKFELKRKVEKYLQGIMDEAEQTEPQNDWETEKRNNSLCYKCVKECDRRVLNRYTIECNQYEPKEQTEREGE